MRDLSASPRAHKPVLLELILLEFIGFLVINADVNYYMTFSNRTRSEFYDAPVHLTPFTFETIF